MEPWEKLLIDKRKFLFLRQDSNQVVLQRVRPSSPVIPLVFYDPSNADGDHIRTSTGSPDAVAIDGTKTLCLNLLAFRLAPAVLPQNGFLTSEECCRARSSNLVYTQSLIRK